MNRGLLSSNAGAWLWTFGGVLSPYCKWVPPTEHGIVDQAAPCMASMVQLLGPENVYIINFVGRMVPSHERGFQ